MTFQHGFHGQKHLDEGCFLPRSCWTTKSKNRQRRGTTNAIFRSSAVVQESTFYVLNPFGHFRNFWDFVGIIFLILDSIILPLQFVNDELYSTYPYLEVNARVAVFYWLADIILSFFTGYLESLGCCKSSYFSLKRAFEDYVATEKSHQDSGRPTEEGNFDTR